MKVESAHSPKWIDELHSGINLMVKFKEHQIEMPFTALPTDVEGHGRNLFDDAKNGKYGIVEEYSRPTIPLTSLKLIKLNILKQNLISKREHDITALGRQWSTDSDSKRCLADAIEFAKDGGDLPAYLRDSSGKKKTISSLNDMQTILKRMQKQYTDAHKWFGDKKELIEESTSNEILNAIDLEN
jgi:hypothetical protein